MDDNTVVQHRFAAITLANDILFRKITAIRDSELIIQGINDESEKIKLTEFHSMETLIAEADKIVKFIYSYI